MANTTVNMHFYGYHEHNWTIMVYISFNMAKLDHNWVHDDNINWGLLQQCKAYKGINGHAKISTKGFLVQPVHVECIQRPVSFFISSMQY